MYRPTGPPKEILQVGTIPLWGMFILNEVETSHILISIRLYFILMILITEDGLQPSILSDCNFNSSAGEVSGTQASQYIGY
jgi:hypothetical protein